MTAVLYSGQAFDLGVSQQTSSYQFCTRTMGKIHNQVGLTFLITKVNV